MGIERKTQDFKEVTIESSSSNGSIHGVLSSFGNVDSYKDTIIPGAYKETIPDFLQNGFLSWSHAWNIPVGTISDAKEVDSGLYIAADFHGTDAAQQARQIASERLARGKTMGLSIGYEPQKATQRDDGVRELRQIKLYEAGLVMVPADSHALVADVKGIERPDWRLVLQALASGGDIAQLVETRANEPPAYKGALPYVATDKADPDTAWDGPGVMADCDGRAQLRKVCTWVDPEGDPDAKSSYKLPHHLPNGEVVLKGVQAAMGALLGARGGVAIPDADRRAVWSHLAKHYGQFSDADGKPLAPPEFRTAQPLADHAQRVLTELESLGQRCQDIRDLRAKEGRVLSRATITRLREVHQAHAAVGDQIAAMIADHDAAEGGKEAERLFAQYLQLQARLRGVPA